MEDVLNNEDITAILLGPNEIINETPEDQKEAWNSNIHDNYGPQSEMKINLENGGGNNGFHGSVNSSHQTAPKKAIPAGVKKALWEKIVDKHGVDPRGCINPEDLKFESMCGSGSYGVVWKAICKGRPRAVAVKSVHAVDDEEKREINEDLLIKERKIMSHWGGYHDNII
jgi:hypothetical protein